MAKKEKRLHHVKLQATAFLDDLRSIEWIVLMGDDKTFADVPAFHYSFLIRPALGGSAPIVARISERSL